MPNASSNTPAPTKPVPSSAEQGSVPWNPWLGVLFVILVYYVAQLASGILLSVYPGLRHWSQSQAIDWLNNSVGAQFIFILLAEALSIGALYYFLKRYKVSFALIGFKRPRATDPLYGLLAAPAYFVLYGITVGLVSHFVSGLNVNQTQEIGFNSVHGGLPLVLTFISLVVLPPLTEEIMVRGFLYSSLKKALPTIGAVLLTSAIFAAAHLPEGGSAGPLYIAAIDTFILSLVLIYLREKTGNLWAGITLHALKNGVAFVALFVLHVK